MNNSGLAKLHCCVLTFPLFTSFFIYFLAPWYLHCSDNHSCVIIYKKQWTAESSCFIFLTDICTTRGWNQRFKKRTAGEEPRVTEKQRGAGREGCWAARNEQGVAEQRRRATTEEHGTARNEQGVAG